MATRTATAIVFLRWVLPWLAISLLLNLGALDEYDISSPNQRLIDQWPLSVLAPRACMKDLNLNSQVGVFPHLGSYQ